MGENVSEQGQGALQVSTGSPNGRQTIMGGKELPKLLRDKIVEGHVSGEGYRKISKSLNISPSTIRTIIRKWKVHHTTETLPRSGRPPKLSNQARTRLVTEATVRPIVTLKELKSSIAVMGENVSEQGQGALEKPGSCTCETHPVAQKKAQTVVAREEPVKKKCGRKALPPELRARKLLKSHSKTLPRQPKPAIKKPLLPDSFTGIRRSSRARVGVQSGQPSSSSGQGQGALEISTGSPNGRQTIMGGKELPKLLRDKIVERHVSGEGYKKISKSLNISPNTIRSIILKWKVRHTTETLPRSGRPPKLSNQARTKLVTEATVRPTVTLKELQSSIVEMGENVCESTISRSLNKAGLYYK
ncbi:hypothetical protein SKAU_G00125510 [Synaphobranchus kaupii]|uniref:Sleeping Beauty transposase HTH domain-containing protein n=1 Tax=Synaphobranchus kaupii TaxID=118154 RepID=A0A9Q1FQ15_SYNKA|nr:hypothetical protein SKAU_G00125510 [Synaphobranchus kaupii]